MSTNVPDNLRQVAVDFTAEVDAKKFPFEVQNAVELRRKLRSTVSKESDPGPTVFYSGFTPSSAKPPKPKEEKKAGSSSGATTRSKAASKAVHKKLAELKDESKREPKKSGKSGTPRSSPKVQSPAPPKDAPKKEEPRKDETAPPKDATKGKEPEVVDDTPEDSAQGPEEPAVPPPSKPKDPVIDLTMPPPPPPIYTDAEWDRLMKDSPQDGLFPRDGKRKREDEGSSGGPPHRRVRLLDPFDGDAGASSSERPSFFIPRHLLHLTTLPATKELVVGQLRQEYNARLGALAITYGQLVDLAAREERLTGMTFGMFNAPSGSIPRVVQIDEVLAASSAAFNRPSETAMALLPVVAKRSPSDGGASGRPKA